MAHETKLTVNGYPIVAMFPTPRAHLTRAGRFIMVDRGEASPHRWVVAWHGDGDDCWHQGYYTSDQHEARSTFIELCAEEIGREVAPAADPVPTVDTSSLADVAAEVDAEEAAADEADQIASQMFDTNGNWIGPVRNENGWTP